MKNLSQKELYYIKDALSWELLSTKKCYQYGHQEEDLNSQYKQIFFDAAHAHEQNYLSLLNYVNQINMNQGGQLH